MGTILRTADAFRSDGLLLVNGCADLYNPKTVRATMGAVFRCPVWSCSVETLAALLEAAAWQGLRTVGGIDLLIRQAVRAFTFFTGETPDTAALYATLREPLDLE